MKFLPKFPMMTGWNFINYDWQYIVNRCKILNSAEDAMYEMKRLKKEKDNGS